MPLDGFFGRGTIRQRYCRKRTPETRNSDTPNGTAGDLSAWIQSFILFSIQATRLQPFPTTIPLSDSKVSRAGFPGSGVWKDIGTPSCFTRIPHGATAVRSKANE